MQKAVIAAGVLVLAAVAATACSSSTSTTATAPASSAPAAQTTLKPVAQPPGAAQVAKSVGATGFVDKGASEAGGSIDSGTAMLHGRKIAINTFPAKSVRDSWLKAAEQFGVSPLFESDTAVVYYSVSGS
jgi:hypothetical protein